MRRLREHDLVVVSLPSDVLARTGSFDCHVLAVVGSTAALEPRRKADVLWLPPQVDGALMSFRAGPALVGLKGVLSTKEAIGDLRFRVTDGVHMPRLEATRLRLCAPITLRLGGGPQSEGVTIELGADGILAESRLDASVGDQVELRLSLPGSDAPVETTARVVRRDGGLVGVQLTDRGTRTTLGTFVLEYNRAQLHRARGDLAELDF